MGMSVHVPLVYMQYCMHASNSHMNFWIPYNYIVSERVYRVPNVMTETISTGFG